MKKYEILHKANKYYNMARIEHKENGDTNKRRDYMYKSLTLFEQYYEILKGKSKFYKEAYKELKEELEQVSFTPTKEDIEEMKYWF